MNHRREFIAAAGVFGAGLVAMPGVCPGQEPEKPAQIEAKLVGQFVGKSHGDLNAVKELLTKEPALINATWDWGNGDWETGLGAASHVGRPDIAEYLLEQGARLDAFAATMLGLKPIVAQMLIAFPKIHSVPGPHGICLLSHAIAGREKAAPVFELLIEAGANVNSRSNQQMTPLMVAARAGRKSIVETLLAKGADPTAVDANQQSALSLAKQREQTDVIPLLEAALKANASK